MLKPEDIDTKDCDGIITIADSVNINNSSEDVRDGLILAASRTYGEQFLEPFIRWQYGLVDGEDGCDAFDPVNKLNYEIKCCKVLQKNTDFDDKLINRILGTVKKSETRRIVKYSDRFCLDYDANVQNVKRDHFDYLLYCLLFADCVEVFKINKDDVKKPEIPNWSDKHGRYDALGKSGQFNITKKHIKHHEEKYLENLFTYDWLTKAYEVLSD